MPIAGMLVRSVANPELRTVMPQTAALIRDWDGAGLPDERIFASFAAELRHAYDGAHAGERGQATGLRSAGLS